MLSCRSYVIYLSFVGYFKRHAKFLKSVKNNPFLDDSFTKSVCEEIRKKLGFDMNR